MAAGPFALGSRWSPAAVGVPDQPEPDWPPTPGRAFAPRMPNESSTPRSAGGAAQRALLRGRPFTDDPRRRSALCRALVLAGGGRGGQRGSRPFPVHASPFLARRPAPAGDGRGGPARCPSDLTADELPPFPRRLPPDLLAPAQRRARAARVPLEAGSLLTDATAGPRRAPLRRPPHRRSPAGHMGPPCNGPARHRGHRVSHYHLRFGWAKGGYFWA